MGDVINLNTFRKQRQKAEKGRKAAVNRVKFGRLKADKDLAQAEQDQLDHALDLKKVEPIPFVPPTENTTDSEDEG